MRARTRLLAGLAAAAASVIALSGCTGHASDTHTAAPTAHPLTLADGVLKGVHLPGLVDGSDGQGDLLVRLDGSDSTPAQLKTSSYGDGYALFDTSGKQLSWAAASPVADAYDVYLTTAGLFVQRESDAWDLSRVDPKTGAVLWSFNEAPNGDGTDMYFYDTFWNDSGSGGELVVLEHDSRDPNGTHDYHHDLTVLDAQTGQQLFTIPDEDPNNPSYEATHQIQILSYAPFITATVAGGAYSEVVARDPKTGAITAQLDPKWFPRTGLETTGTAFVTSVVDGAKKTKVIARDATGKTLWTRVVDAPQAAVSTANARHVIVQEGNAGTVYALSATSGKLEGSYAPNTRSTLSAFLTKLVGPDLMTVSSQASGVYLIPVPGTAK
jgi:hypothetical protein